MDWSEVTGRVVVEAVAAHPQDVVVAFGADAAMLAALAGRVKRVLAVGEAPPADVSANTSFQHGDPRSFPLPADTSVVLLHEVFRHYPRHDQRAILRRMGQGLRPRALLVIGDVMWSMPLAQIDEPEQFGSPLGDPPSTRWIEDEARAAGFLPDLHRFGVGRAVLIAIRGDA